MEINKINQFLAYVNSVMTRQLEKSDKTPIEKTAVKLGIYYIFEKNYDLELIYKEVLNYLTKYDELNYIIPEIEKYHSNI